MDLKKQEALSGIGSILEGTFKKGSSHLDGMMRGISKVLENAYHKTDPSGDKNTTESYDILRSLGVEPPLDYHNLPPKVGDIGFGGTSFYTIGESPESARGNLKIARGKSLIYLLNNIGEITRYTEIQQNIGFTHNNLYQQIRDGLGFEINSYSKIFSLSAKPQWCKLSLKNQDL